MGPPLRSFAAAARRDSTALDSAPPLIVIPTAQQYSKPSLRGLLILIWYRGYEENGEGGRTSNLSTSVSHFSFSFLATFFAFLVSFFSFFDSLSFLAIASSLCSSTLSPTTSICFDPVQGGISTPISNNIGRIPSGKPAIRRTGLEGIGTRDCGGPSCIGTATSSATCHRPRCARSRRISSKKEGVHHLVNCSPSLDHSTEDGCSIIRSAWYTSILVLLWCVALPLFRAKDLLLALVPHASRQAHGVSV